MHNIIKLNKNINAKLIITILNFAEFIIQPLFV